MADEIPTPEQVEAAGAQMRESLGAGLFQLVETSKLILDSVSGYRKECEAQGFSPTAAEAMAMELHSQLIRSFYSG